MKRDVEIKRSVLAIATALCVTLCSCTEVRIYGADQTDVHDYVGIVSMSISSQRNPSFVSTESIGIGLGVSSIAIGWMEQEISLFPDPDRCSVLVVAESADTIRDIEALLSRTGHSVGNVCISRRPENASPAT